MTTTQTHRVPFQPKARQPDLDQRITEALQAVAAVTQLEADQLAARKAPIEARRQALRAALDAGATLADLARHLGISPGRVHQLAKGDE